MRDPSTDLGRRLTGYSGIATRIDEDLIVMSIEVRQALAAFFAANRSSANDHDLESAPIEAVEQRSVDATGIVGERLLADFDGLVDEVVVFDHGAGLLASEHLDAVERGIDTGDHVRSSGGSPLTAAGRAARRKLPTDSATSRTVTPDGQIVERFHERTGDKAGKRAACRLRAMIETGVDGSQRLPWGGALRLLDDVWAWAANPTYLKAFSQTLGADIRLILEDLLVAGHPELTNDELTARADAFHIVQALEQLIAHEPTVR